jgi:hypothetical protein
MTNLRSALLLVCFGSVTLAACDSSDPNSNVGTNPASTETTQGPDEALNERNCYVGLSLPGAKYTGFACSGITRDSTVSAIGPKSWNDVLLSIDLSLKSPPAIGSLDLAELTFSIPNADGSSLIWNAQLESCTAQAVKSALDDDFGWMYYRIDLNCTKPALPADGNSREPMELGQFSIVTFFKA